MAFLAPAAAAAAGTAATAATVTGAGAALGSGIAAGTALGAGVGLKAGAAMLAPTLGAGLGATGAGLAGLGAAGAGLGGAGLAGLGGLGLKAGAGALLPGLASAGGAGLGGLGAAGLGGIGLKGAGAMLAPKLGATLPASALAAAPTASTFAQAAPNLIGRDQILQAFSQQNLGQGLPQLGPNLAGPVDPTALAFKPVSQNASFLNTMREGAAIPGVTSNMTPQLMGNVAGGPAIQGVTSGLSTTTAPLVPASTAPAASQIVKGQNFLQNAGNFFQDPSMDAAIDYVKEHPYATAAGAYGISQLMKPKSKAPEQQKALIRPYEFTRTQRPEAYGTNPSLDSSERLYFNEQFTPLEPYEAPGPEYKRAAGGILGYAVGGPVEQMAALNAVGANTGYPMAGINTPMYSNPLVQRPEAFNVISPSGDAGVGVYSGEPRFAKGGDVETEGGYTYSYDPRTLEFTQLSVPTVVQPSNRQVGVPFMGNSAPTAKAVPQPAQNTGSKISGGISSPAMGPMQAPQSTPINIPAYQTPEERLGLTEFYEMMNRRLAAQGGYAAGGGVSHLGDYSDGGRLLKGPGDGVSDSIPAVIGERQPARLADGEFVVPARIVSELGNGSTEAGARKLYAMMDRVQKARRKTVGKDRVAANTKADKHLPA